MKGGFLSLIAKINIKVDRLNKKGQTLQCEKFVQKVFHVNYFYTNTNNSELE